MTDAARPNLTANPDTPAQWAASVRHTLEWAVRETAPGKRALPSAVHSRLQNALAQAKALEAAL